MSRASTSPPAGPASLGAAAGWIRALMAGYRPIAGAHDEMMAPNGSIRPPWDRFFGELAGLDKAQLTDAFGRAARHLTESGVFFRVYDDPAGGERPWPLAPMPLLIDAPEWKRLEAGVIQRARLAEAVLADVYGDGRLSRDGVLPAAAIAGSPDFLRPLVGMPPPGGRHLHLYAVDLGRGPDGNWWVLSDRTQAPSGAGYALENRLALNRALPDVARSLNVQRLAGFFQAFRDELARLNIRAEARVGLLTPGPLNETYFEHAYLARYLGFLLVEGADLTVRDGAVYVRTVAGLKRVDALWRRLDGDFADPLELRTSSRLGVPGLVQAVREGGVTVANGLGSGVLESRALMGFMPALARHVLGEDLILPNLATWWCGQARERAVVLEDFERLVIAPAFEPTLPGFEGRRTMTPGTLGAGDKARLKALVAERGMDVVGQEMVKLSTMPVWKDGALVPRPFVLRLYLAADGAGGWTVMPGGFCRISDRPDARFVSLQQGAAAADVWVIADGPVAETTLLPPTDRVRIRRTIGTLPSRAADNLFWLARYVERLEATLRIVRALTGRLVEVGSGADRPVVHDLLALLQRSGALPETIDPSLGHRFAGAVLTDRTAPGALPQLAGMARSALAVVRDRLAPDAFHAVTEIASRIDQLAGKPLSPAGALDAANDTLRLVAAFSGLASENMTRLTGWRFLELGRRIERAIGTAGFVTLLGRPGEAPGALDALLELGDSLITYRSRYVVSAARAPVLDLLVLDENNPRSVHFQIERIVGHLEALPATTIDGRPTALIRSARRLLASFSTATAEELAMDQVEGAIGDLYRLSEAISIRYFTQRPDRDLPEDLLG